MLELPGQGLFHPRDGLAQLLQLLPALVQLLVEASDEVLHGLDHTARSDLPAGDLQHRPALAQAGHLHGHHVHAGALTAGSQLDPTDGAHRDRFGGIEVVGLIGAGGLAAQGRDQHITCIHALLEHRP